jgi:hypothetical protein
MARLMTRRITYAGIDMTTLLPESSFSQHGPVNSMKHIAAAVPLGRVSNHAAEVLHDDWERQVQSLRQLICELLLKNQQLRWALTEMREHELGAGKAPQSTPITNLSSDLFP